jgi:hypothetical protein
MVARSLGEGDKVELLFSEYRVSVVQDEKVLEIYFITCSYS